MDKLQEIISLCNGGVQLFVNEHKDERLSAKAHIDQMVMEGAIAPPETEVYNEIVARDEVIELYAFPYTEVRCCYYSIHYDLDAAATNVLEQVKADCSSEEGQ